MRTNEHITPLVFEGLVVQAVAHSHRSRMVTPAKQPSWVPLVEMYLHEHFDERLTLRELSSQAGIHPAHLCTQFRRYFHESFSGYLKKLRLMKALDELLKNDDCNLTRLAYGCGFSDQSHFIRCLRQQVGITPGAFRKLTRFNES